MEFLKSLFTKPLSFDEFSEAATKVGIKLADLAKKFPEHKLGE